MKLHTSGEDYLETILVLQKKLGMVRSVDVARHTEVSKLSVCHAVATLRDGGFLTMDKDRFLHLTDVGLSLIHISSAPTSSTTPKRGRSMSHIARPDIQRSSEIGRASCRERV